MRRLAPIIGLTIATAWLTAAPVAGAQEYAQETGDLELTQSVILTLSGDGFLADSAVILTLTAEGAAEGIDLGTFETDSTGAFSESLTLPDDLNPGTFTMAATGVTEDGATRVLSATVSIGGDVTTGSTTTTTTTTTVAETTSTTVAATTTEAESTTTLTASPPIEDAEDSDLLVLILSGVIVILLGVIGGQWWLYRRR